MTSSRDVDGGWAWIVLGASYFNQLLCAGLAFVGGMFQVIFLEEFNGSVAFTAWVTGLFSALLQLAGPLASSVSNAWGCRTCVMIGGGLLAIGFLISGLVNSLEWLLVSFGVVAGLGLGMTYISSIVVINYFFDKKRTLVNGIASSAGGLGIILAPQISQFLFESYSRREALFILAGISAHICIAGALMFPVHEKLKTKNALCRLKEKGKTYDENIRGESEQCDYNNWEVRIENEIEMNNTIECNTCRKTYGDETKIQESCISNRELCVDDSSSLLQNSKTVHESDSESLKTNKTCVQERNSVENYESANTQEQRHGTPCPHCLHRSASTTDNDIVKEEVMIEHQNTDTPMLQALFDSTHRYPRLYKNGPFLVLCLSMFTSNAGAGCFLIHVPSYFQSRNLSGREITNIMSFNGVTVLLGRCLVGALANSQHGNEELFLITMMTIGGTAMLLYPILGDGYVSCLVLMFIIGGYAGTAFCLLPTLTIQYVGLKRLSTAFGVQMVCCGIGYLISPPLTGMIVDITGNYEINLYTGGMLFVLGGLICMLLPGMSKEKRIKLKD